MSTECETQALIEEPLADSLQQKPESTEPQLSNEKREHAPTEPQPDSEPEPQPNSEPTRMEPQPDIEQPEPEPAEPYSEQDRHEPARLTDQETCEPEQPKHNQLEPQVKPAATSATHKV